MYRKGKFLVLVILSGLLVIQAPPLAAEHSTSTVLSAQKSDVEVDIDGFGSEPLWNKAQTLIVPVVDGKIGDIDVLIKVLYDADYIYLYVEWPDPTQSDYIYWTYNGSGSWIKPEATTEDIFSIFWNINHSVPGYDIAGCSVTCHGDRMYTYAPDEKLDYWKWKADKTDPMGYMWDGYLDNTKELDDEIEPDYSPPGVRILKTWHAHKTDSSQRGYEEEVRNAIVDNTGKELRPTYYKRSETSTGEKHISGEDIQSGAAVEFNFSETFNDGTPIPLGYKIPAYIIEKPERSAGDISAKGVYYGGRWHLEIKRALDTGNPDDIRFDVTRTYRFSIAINDDSHGAANKGYGQGHSISMLAKTLEFGGTGSEELTDLALINDHLTTAKEYSIRGNPGLAYSEIGDALTIFNGLSNKIVEMDPELFVESKEEFVRVRRDTTPEKIDHLMGKINDISLTFQGKRDRGTPSRHVLIIVLWGKIQTYAFILLAILVLHPLYRAYQLSRKRHFKRMSIFLILVTVPLLFEGMGRAGILFDSYFLHNFSFLTSEYASLGWAMLMLAAMLIAREGFSEADENINKLERYAEKLKKTGDYLKTLLNSMDEGMMVIDKNYTVTDANPAYCKMMGYDDVKDCIGKKCHSLSHGFDEPCKGDKDICPVNNILETGEPNQVIHTHYDREGREKYIELVSSPIIDEKGEIVYIMEISRDITDRVIAEEKVRTLKGFYENILESIVTGVWVVDRDNKITYWNRAMERISTVKRENVLGRDPFKLFAKTVESKGLAQLFKSARDGLKPVSYDDRKTMKPDGNISYQTGVLIPLLDGAGRYDGMIATVEDVTERVEAVKELNNLKEFNENIIESSGIGIMVLDRSLKLTAINHAQEELLKKDRKEVLGKNIFDFAGLEDEYYDGEHFREILSKVLDGETYSIRDHSHTTETGQTVYLDFDITPLKIGGEIQGIVFLSEDVIWRVQMELDLKNFAKELKESNELKDLFADIMRHDLLNPIGIVKSTAEMAMEENPGIEDLSIIFKNSTKAIDLIENATMLSKLEDSSEFEKLDLDLRESIEEISSELSPLFEGAGMQLINNVNSPTPIRANPMIEHVFINFLTNTVKYAQDGKRVIIDVQEEGDRYKILITDFGGGIPDEHKKDIFTRFKRNHKGGVRGTGLGLAIVKRMVELHGGRVWVEDNPEGGSVFVVELPKTQRPKGAE